MDDKENKLSIRINSSTFYGYFKNRLSVNIRKICDKHCVGLRWIFDSNLLEIYGKKDNIDKVEQMILDELKNHACIELKLSSNIKLPKFDHLALTPIVTDDFYNRNTMYIGPKDNLIQLADDLWSKSYLDNFTLITFNNTDFRNLDDDNDYLKLLNDQDDVFGEYESENSFFEYLTESEKNEISEQKKEEEKMKSLLQKSNENHSRKTSLQDDVHNDESFYYKSKFKRNFIVAACCFDIKYSKSDAIAMSVLLGNNNQFKYGAQKSVWDCLDEEDRKKIDNTITKCNFKHGQILYQNLLKSKWKAIILVLLSPNSVDDLYTQLRKSTMNLLKAADESGNKNLAMTIIGNSLNKQRISFLERVQIVLNTIKRMLKRIL
ncbi:DgyrCDS2028 [Dimorphilus gyrociliatus]|uniref:DgyrCDS2028 n=1 Tax=Dimorphilus gyrociliatus TaxID=2664684 RepID=A0A7I8V993_9ANNE|nr:DgyrCDS2028 [Dimorphilus gyrociliatus]